MKVSFRGMATDITFNHQVTGNGDYGGTVVMSGGYNTGEAPETVDFENVTFSSTNSLTIKFGGLDRGAEYDALDVSGTANLGGMLTGFTNQSGRRHVCAHCW